MELSNFIQEYLADQEEGMKIFGIFLLGFNSHL